MASSQTRFLNYVSSVDTRSLLKRFSTFFLRSIRTAKGSICVHIMLRCFEIKDDSANDTADDTITKAAALSRLA